MPDAPSGEYRTRLAARTATHNRLQREDALLSYSRLSTFALGVGLAAAAWWGALSWWWIAAPLVVFVGLVVRQDRVGQAMKAAARAIAFYQRGLARIEDRWSGSGETGERFGTEHHLYANDLDLFGEGSLFQLMSIARTRAGEEALAAWLKQPADPDEIRIRHEAVRELTPALDLREQVAIVGADVRRGVDPDALIAWANKPRALSPPWLRWATMLLTATTVVTVVLALSTGVYLPFLIAFAVQGALQLRQGQQILHILHGADGPARDLAILQRMVARLERESFSATRLLAIRQQFDSQGTRASRAIQWLERLVEAHDWAHNLVFTPIALVLMWSTHLAWAIDAWRLEHGRHIEMWLRAVGEFEALSSIATYRYEHPADPFPEIAADATTTRSLALFHGSRLGHPLLPAAKMVANDLHLDSTAQLLVVSGSNMSGKSTLLRTVGVNAVLALAGAPIRGESLRLSPLSLGATLRIQDSLQEGRSRFFAEITRIRELADAANGPRPLLFLLDELLHGTNSHDRLIGASGILRGLLDRGAIGLITTHDLALTAIANDLGPRASNVHFDDRFENGEMLFDYRMKPGPVTHSNAVALMRAIGLDVPEGHS